jgi:hypothetical protein
VRQRNVGKQPIFGTYHQAKPCECGKRGYPDRHTAKDVIREMRRQGKVRSDRIDAYRCLSDPDYWHVGHRPECHIGLNLNDPGTWTA